MGTEGPTQQYAHQCREVSQQVMRHMSQACSARGTAVWYSPLQNNQFGNNTEWLCLIAVLVASHVWNPRPRACSAEFNLTNSAPTVATMPAAYWRPSPSRHIRASPAQHSHPTAAAQPWSHMTLHCCGWACTCQSTSPSLPRSLHMAGRQSAFSLGRQFVCYMPLLCSQKQLLSLVPVTRRW